MPEPTFKLLVSAMLLLLGYLAAYLFRRRPGSRPTVDPVAKYRRLRLALIAYGLLLVIEGVAAILTHGRPVFQRVWPPILFAACFGGILLEFVRARKKLRELPNSGWPGRRPETALFFWQAALILLPVAGLAGFGLYSLRQDREIAEQEAREAGKVLADGLAQAISVEGGRRISDYRNASFELHANRTADLGQSKWAGGAASESNAWERIKAWQQANPEIDLTTQPPVDPERYGERRPETMPPRPAEWLGQLDAAQQQLWQAAKQLEFAAGDFPAALAMLEEFIASKPPAGARANAEYLRLLAQAHGLSSQEASNVFAHSAWSQSDEVTEAGLPVGQLIWYQRLRRMPDGAGLPGGNVSSIGWSILYRRSMISSRLIAEVARVARGTKSETNAATLAAWWDANEKARMVFEDFCEQHPTNTWSIAPFPVNSRAGKYILVLGTPWWTPADPEAPEELRYDYLLFPEAVVEKAFATAALQAGITLPAYARVELDFGKTFILSHDPAASASEPLSGQWPLLGQATGALRDMWIGTNALPFSVRVLLGSPEILFARQRQRTWLFSGLIVFSALTAAAGLIAAGRAFRRQVQLNEQKSNFVSSVSHELRTPIASMRLMAENLAGGKIPESARQGEYFGFMVQECRRLSALIENVLDFARIEQGRKQYEFEPTDLEALVAATVRLMEPYATEKGVALKSETGAGQPWTITAPQPDSGHAGEARGEARPAAACHLEINVDGRAIQQALVNLIDNAVKHSPKGETVTVGMGPGAGGVARIYVADRGAGIPAAEQERIFERFYRLGTELRRETQGVGIGLSVVKHIVEAHGGRVVVESAVGRGSRFTIELPFGPGN